MLSRIRFLFRSRNKRRLCVQSLVVPMISWAGAWTTRNKKFLHKITTKIERCILGRITPGRSPTLIWALIGLNVHLVFQQIVTALRVWSWQAWQQQKEGTEPYLSNSACQSSTSAIVVVVNESDTAARLMPQHHPVYTLSACSPKNGQGPKLHQNALHVVYQKRAGQQLQIGESWMSFAEVELVLPVGLLHSCCHHREWRCGGTCEEPHLRHLRLPDGQLHLPSCRGLDLGWRLAGDHPGCRLHGFCW